MSGFAKIKKLQILRNSQFQKNSKFYFWYGDFKSAPETIWTEIDALKCKGEVRNQRHEK